MGKILKVLGKIIKWYLFLTAMIWAWIGIGEYLDNFHGEFVLTLAEAIHKEWRVEEDLIDITVDRWRRFIDTYFRHK